jgi:hypothetical protein
MRKDQIACVQDGGVGEVPLREALIDRLRGIDDKAGFIWRVGRTLSSRLSASTSRLSAKLG